MKRATEYSVLTIDQYGDCLDTVSFDRKPDAISHASQLSAVAVLVEQRRMCWDEHGELLDIEYKTVCTYGDRSALVAGEWLEE